jgi:hypothetical protein
MIEETSFLVPTKVNMPRDFECCSISNACPWSSQLYPKNEFSYRFWPSLGEGFVDPRTTLSKYINIEMSETALNRLTARLQLRNRIRHSAKLVDASI